jgi:translation initiation factor 4A
MSTENEISPDEVKAYASFEEMALPDNLLRGVYGYGYERPSAIQQKAIMPIKEGRDVLAQAQSGTGKTGAFVIGSLCNFDPSIPKPQILVLVHTHELADQHAKTARALGSFLGAKVLCAVGGMPLKDDIKALENGAQFIVGTPGRVYDLLNRGVLDRSHLKQLILDEADEMLDDLFYKQVRLILEMGFPTDTKVAMFSATMPENVIEVANSILNNPVKILIPPTAVRLDGIQQFFVGLDREDHKFECIADLYKHLNIAQAVIFCNKRQTADVLSSKMQALGYPITCLHGDLERNERISRWEQFLKGTTRVMIATDVISRGIDIQQISLVINYELPPKIENYVHRIGRAGRYGRKGTTINLLVAEEEAQMKKISDHYGMTISPLPDNIAALKLS